MTFDLQKFHSNKPLYRIYKHFMHDSLYRNSIFLMGSTLITAFFGFIFWVINARIFPPEQIGIATAIISATSLLIQFSLLGLKNGIIRYLPKSGTKNDKINTGTNAIILFSIVICVCFLIGIPLLSSQLIFLTKNIFFSILFAIFVTSFSLNQFQEGIFVAYRSTQYVFLKNALWGLMKVVCAFFVVSFGAFGVFFAFSIGSVISFFFGVGVITKKFQYLYSPRIYQKQIQKMWRFSFGDYLGTFFAYASQFFIPLIIINHIGAKESAFYYIDMQIIGLLYIIPIATTQSLFAEGSNDEVELAEHVKKSFFFIALLIIPAICMIFLFGNFVLHIFGKQYAGNGLQFLDLLAFTGISYSINSIGSAVMHVKKRLNIFVLLNFISSSLFIILSLLFLSHQLLGVGYALLLSQGVSSIIYLFLLRKTFL